MSNDTGEELAETIYQFCKTHEIVLTPETIELLQKEPRKAALYFVQNAQREFRPRAHGDDLTLEPLHSGETIVISRFLFRATVTAFMSLIDVRHGFHPLLPQRYADRLFNMILGNQICRQKVLQTSPAETKEAAVLPQEAEKVQELYPENDGKDFF